MNSIVIKLHGVNPRSISVYAEGRATKEEILKRFAPDLIKSYLWFHTLKFVTQRNLPQQRILEKALSGPQIKFCKEALFVKYDKKKNVSLLSAPTPIKSLPEGTKVLRSLIATSIKECYCYDAWKFVARHCANGSSQIKGIDFINHTVHWHILTHS